jgi:hypothetical protein
MLNCSRSVLIVCALGSGLVFGLAAGAQTLVHPAPLAKVITVNVTESRHAPHGPDQDVLIAQAVGFPNDTCDVITTFDVVKRYEERQTWSHVRQRIDIVIDGKSYPAKFRDLGFYPLGLNLACIDFESPLLRTQLELPVLPLELKASDPSSLSYDDQEIAKTDPGTPFLNARGEISSVLIATPNGPLEFAVADEIRMFLAAAAGMSPWPTLRQRPLVKI